MFADVLGQGFMPAYEVTGLTDDLHRIISKMGGKAHGSKASFRSFLD